MPETLCVALDLTSTQRPRLTGWERFALTYADRVRSAGTLESVELRWSRPVRGRTSMLGSQLAWYGAGMRRAVSVADVDVVHALAFPPGPTGRPTVWTVHDDLVLGGHAAHARRGAVIWTRLARQSLRWVRAVVTDTRSVAEEIAVLGVPPERIHVATPGVPVLPPPGPPPLVRRMKDGEHVAVPKDFLLAVGTIEARKRPDVAARAAEIVDAPIVLVGRIDPSMDVAFLRDSPVAYLADTVGDGSLAWLYQNARAFVAASAYEGLDFPLLEALAAGTPAAASDIPVHRELAGGVVSFAPVGDADALARAVERASRPSGWSPPTWEACLAVYAEVYRMVSGGEPAA